MAIRQGRRLRHRTRGIGKQICASSYSAANNVDPSNGSEYAHATEKPYEVEGESSKISEGAFSHYCKKLTDMNLVEKIQQMSDFESMYKEIVP